MVDGIAVPDAVVDVLAQDRPRNLTNKLILEFWWIYWARTNLQVFGRKLTVEEMASVTVGGECGGRLEGDYLAWRTMRWLASGQEMVWRGASREELCRRDTPHRFVNTGKLAGDQGVSFCSRLARGSYMPGDSWGLQIQHVGLIILSPSIPALFH